MNREEIKDIVYKCLYEQYYDENIITALKLKPNDGEDELIYNELKFDSLDMIEFILNIEKEIGYNLYIQDDYIINDITLRKIIDYIDNYMNSINNKK